MGVKSTAAPPKNLDFRKEINSLLAFAVLFVVFSISECRVLTAVLFYRR